MSNCRSLKSTFILGDGISTSLTCGEGGSVRELIDLILELLEHQTPDQAQAKETISSPNCPDGYQSTKESSKFCYRFNPQRVNWMTAKENCFNDKGTLVQIPSLDENNDLLELTGNAHLVWIGLKLNGKI